MPERIQVGLAGTGDIGRLHARALAAREDVRLCVCQGVNPTRAQAFAREFEAKLYPSYTDMLTDRSVAAVDICVPNDLHRAYAEQGAAAGKHILCEKPIALTLEDAQAMLDAAGRAGIFLMIAHPLRFWPEYVAARKIIQSGEIGSCHAITMRRMLSLLINIKGEQEWRHHPERMGGALIDLQIHDLDFLNWTFGLPQKVYCAAARSSDGGFNHVYAVFEYSSGTKALVESSYMLQGDPMIFTFKAVCERGTLDYGLNVAHFSMHAMAGDYAGTTASTDPATLICYRGAGEPRVLIRQEPQILESVFERELSYFIDCVQGRAENTIAPPEEAFQALRIALACQESALTGAVMGL